MYDAGLSREAIFGRTCTTPVLKGLISVYLQDGIRKPHIFPPCMLSYIATRYLMLGLCFQH